MKISFIGSGGVGCSTAFACGLKGLFDEFVMIDIFKDYSIGKAMDLEQGFILNEINDVKVFGSDGYDMIKNSDVIVITAGKATHGEGNNRETLLEDNKKIIGEIAEKVKKLVPTDDKQPLIIIVTNPLDIILKHFIDVGNFNKKKTIGSGNWLDTARFKYYLSEAFKIPASKIDTFVIGQHGSKMVYLLSQTKLNNQPLFEYMKSNNISNDKIDEIKEKATQGASTIIDLIVKGGTFYGPAISISTLIESYIKNEDKLITASVWCNGEYGVKGYCVGCPIILGKNGVKEIKIFNNLTKEEEKELEESFNYINSLNK